MPDLNSLGLKDEAVGEIDFEHLRTQGGMGPMPPQPGIYVVRLPSAAVLQRAFDKIDHPEQGERIAVKFSDEALLLNETLGNYYQAYVSNTTREVGKEGERTLTSDMAMLLKVVGSIPQPNERGIVTNRAYANALLAAAGRAFKIEHALTGNCNDKREIYKDGGVQPGSRGCGQKYAVEGYKPSNGQPPVISIPKAANEAGRVEVMLRWECHCGAEIRAFGQIRGFKVHEDVQPPATA